MFMAMVTIVIKMWHTTTIDCGMSWIIDNGNVDCKRRRIRHNLNCINWTLLSKTAVVESFLQLFSDSSVEDDENNLLKKLKKFYREERLNKTHHLNRAYTSGERMMSRDIVGKGLPSGQMKFQTGTCVCRIFLFMIYLSFLFYSF